MGDEDDRLDDSAGVVESLAERAVVAMQALP